MQQRIALWLMVVALGTGFVTGCGSGGGSGDGGDSTSTTVSESNAVPADFAGVVWLHNDVSGWAETASMNVSFGDGFIHMPYDRANVWPGRGGLNGNPWIFVRQDGVWYAATFEWFRNGQSAKPQRVVNGDHIKQPPLQNFSPVSGETYGFMVSGLARDSQRNVEERSNVVMAVWP